MSLARRPYAKLQGWDGPFYPSRIQEIACPVKPRRPMSCIDLDGVARGIRWYRGYSKGETSDGYYWFCLLRFSVLGGSVLIAVPWAQDFDGSDGTMSDRSPAVYARGVISVKAVDKVVGKFADELNAERARR